jgi:hypothetical protein
MHHWRNKGNTTNQYGLEAHLLKVTTTSSSSQNIRKYAFIRESTLAPRVASVNAPLAK